MAKSREEEGIGGGAPDIDGAQPRGLPLHIGLNAVDPAHYAGWSGPLNACEADANDMAAIAKKSGMKSTVLLTQKGTRAKALAGIRAAAKKLKRGDFFLLTYSGHGGQVTDVTDEEPDGKDETWCLYDGELIDDELYAELSRFAAGVRVLVLSDSCHSGTVTRARPEPPPPGTRSKMMPPDIAEQTYQQNKAFYDKLQKDGVEGGRRRQAAGSRHDAGAGRHRSAGGENREEVQALSDPDLRVSGQPDLA